MDKPRKRPKLRVLSPIADTEAEQGVRSAQRTLASIIGQLDPESVEQPAKASHAPKKKA